ncbi:MAG TPA: peptide-methionine (S)-S-oxide reductase MsrA [Novosphingobium sp.]|nr:peptide-methionine (S)-S-oxide reductase MsrA [Novosphingobium sp.]
MRAFAPIWLLLGGVMGAALPLPAAAIAAQADIDVPPAASPAQEAPGPRQAIFAGGCFWGVEAVFSHVKGVSSAVSGYHGGNSANANYDAVSAGGTDHAESVRVTYDPAVVRYDQLLQIFFSVIVDPTQRDRQGPDVGHQYRSALVPLSPEQKRVGQAYLAQLGAAHVWPRPIATRIETYRGFFPAEAYHQDFMAKNPRHPYILFWDVPKVAALQRLFPALYKADFTRQ